MTIINEENVNRGNAQKIKPWDYGVAKNACLGVAAIEADTGYILVDLSDTTNFPHLNTAAIILKSLQIETDIASSGVFTVLFGVVTEVDASNGSVNWFARVQLETAQSQGHPRVLRWPSGLNLRVTAGATPFLVTNIADSGDVLWQTDTVLTTPVGTVAPAAGDLVMKIDEISGTGNVDVFVEAEYDTI